MGKLAEEVEQVALSLRVARQSMIEEAQGRMGKGGSLDGETSPGSGRGEARREFALLCPIGNPTFMFSMRNGTRPNDVPGKRGGDGNRSHHAGLRRGTWVARQRKRRQEVRQLPEQARGPARDERYILKRVWLTKEEEEVYTTGLPTRIMAPVLYHPHAADLPETDWQMYRKFNEKFAESLLEELPVDKPFVFIQDYHFTLLPQMIKQKRPDATIALFWHIPGPIRRSFRSVPTRSEILKGMLGYDLIGFHVQNHCNNFLDTANRLMESRVDTENSAS